MTRKVLFLGSFFVLLVLLPLAPSASAQTACAPAWQSGMSVTVGQMVSFNSNNWKAIQPEVSAAPNWQPPNVPALWTLVGPCEPGGGGNTCTAAPSVPTGLTPANITSSGVTLNWTTVAPPANCTVSYTVFQNGTSIGTTSSTSFPVTGLTPATSFMFSVAASDVAGASAQSAAIKVTTLANTCNTVPGAPTGLSASGTTTSSTNLNWTAATVSQGCSVSNYTVFQNGTSIGTTNSTSFSVTGLVPATSFMFSVAASDVAGTSAQSAAIKVTTLTNACNAVPSAPTGLTASGTTTSSTNLSWTAATVSQGCSVSNYTVFQNGTSIGTTTGTSFTVNGLSAATTFTFAVVANDAAGPSAQSGAISVTTLPGGNGGGGNGRLMIGYWHDFDNGSADIPLAKVSSQFDVIIAAFGETTTDSSTISFTVDAVHIESQAQFIADIQTLHGQGKKVLLSIGGANGHVALNTAQDVTNFVQSVSGLIQQYGFDGIDIDIESNSLVLASGDNDFMNPKTPGIVNTINALHQLAAKFPGFMLTFAPQIEDVQEANIAFVSSFGDQLPLLWGCRDIMSWVHVQDYNSGGTNALDGKNYNQGTADFLVAMTEMLVHGFTLANGQTFPGFPAGQVALGVPAGPGAAGAGIVAPSAVQQAVNYLVTGKSFGGQYTLQNPAGYPGLRGVMTWSVNWDQVNGFGMSNTVAPFLHGLPAIPAVK